MTLFCMWLWKQHPRVSFLYKQGNINIYTVIFCLRNKFYTLFSLVICGRYRISGGNDDKPWLLSLLHYLSLDCLFTCLHYKFENLCQCLIIPESLKQQKWEILYLGIYRKVYKGCVHDLFIISWLAVSLSFKNKLEWISTQVLYIISVLSLSFIINDETA